MDNNRAKIGPQHDIPKFGLLRNFADSKSLTFSSLFLASDSSSFGRTKACFESISTLRAAYRALGERRSHSSRQIRPERTRNCDSELNNRRF